MNEKGLRLLAPLDRCYAHAIIVAPASSGYPSRGLIVGFVIWTRTLMGDLMGGPSRAALLKVQVLYIKGEPVETLADRNIFGKIKVTEDLGETEGRM